MSKQVALGEYLASLPIQVGYELDNQVLAIPTKDGRVGMISTLQWNESVAPGRDIAETFAAQVIQIARANDLGNEFLLVGYGPSGTDRLQQVNDALLATADLPTPVLAHVQDGNWRQRRDGQEWSTPHPLPDVRAAAVAEGESLPAHSRAELSRRYDPGTAHFDAGAPPGFIWQAHPPSFRADILTRTLDQLAKPGHPHDPDRMTIIAHLMTTDPVVRDAGIVAATKDRGRAEALVRTYQASPLESRPTLATAAATALFLSGESNVAVQAILSHAARTGPGATLTETIEQSLNAGVHPNKLRPVVEDGSRQALGEADTRWEELRQQYLGDRQPTPVARALPPELTPGPNQTKTAGRRRPEPGEVAQWVRQHAASDPRQSGPTID